MSEAVLETRVSPVWHILIFVLSCFPMAIGISGIVKGMFLWPIFIFFGPWFFLFLYSILFSKLKVYADGITFRMYHVYFDEMGRIKLKWGGRLLVFGKLNWYLLLNPEEFVGAVKTVKPEVLVKYRKPVRRWKPIIYSVIPFVFLTMLWAIEYALGCIGVVIDPLAWAFVWGVVAALSTAAWVYWLPPHRYRVLGLGRLGTSVTIGLVIGIPVFLIMLMKLFV